MSADNLLLKLEKSKNKTLEELNIDDVDDISDFKIDKRKTSNERILDYLEKAKNPYAFKVNGKIVKIEFSDSDLTASDCLTNVLDSLYK